ncbi:MAG: zinc dependent phospholipase C family protein [Thermodesulfovibrionales bacterium]|nr:zinc dependent phospholipase C family protein [Thermodesulfovibrionales bacterium]
MKRLVLIILGLNFLFISSSSAFNPGTHIYIAEKVFQIQDNDLYYGSIAPDIAIYADPEKWPFSFEDTHYFYIDLRPYAVNYTQRIFALGWLSHNEVSGADYYAHRINPLGNNICVTNGYYQGYVIEKACKLREITGIDPEFAHMIIESAIDLLLRNRDDRRLGEKLLYSNLFRSAGDLNLLIKVFVWKVKRTDLLTLATAELTFRNLVNRYAIALTLPDPYNKKALAALGSQLALEMFGVEVTEEDALNLLEIAVSLCERDYKNAVDITIREIKKGFNFSK